MAPNIQTGTSGRYPRCDVAQSSQPFIDMTLMSANKVGKLKAKTLCTNCRRVQNLHGYAMTGNLGPLKTEIRHAQNLGLSVHCHENRYSLLCQATMSRIGKRTELRDDPSGRGLPEPFTPGLPYLVHAGQQGFVRKLISRKIAGRLYARPAASSSYRQ
jgi:hypothetical protein